MEKQTVTQEQLKSILDFIRESSIQIFFNLKYRDSDVESRIKVLLPYQYQYFMKEYMQRYGFQNPYDGLKELKFSGITINFFSPTNDCYVFLEDGIMITKEIEGVFSFKLKLGV